MLVLCYTACWNLVHFFGAIAAICCLLRSTHQTHDRLCDDLTCADPSRRRAMVSEACAQPRGSSAMAVSRVSSPPPTSNENSQPTAENWCFTQVSVCQRIAGACCYRPVV